MTLDLEHQIRERAYQLWEQDGRVHGRADEYWFAAARELTSRQPSSPAEALAQGGDIIVANVAEPKTEAEPKTRRRAPAKTAAAPAAAPRRRRSPTTPLSS